MDSKTLDTCSRNALSSLPDEVLGNILSSLTTKEAASTSVLSKKWRNVFALVHNLDFDDSVSLQAREPKEALWYECPESLENFVDRTLALQSDYLIKKFSLKCDGVYKKTFVSSWISNVLVRGVLELNLRIKYRIAHCIPSQLFTSKTLVKLTLGTQLYLRKLPSSVSLPSLKTLFIHTIFVDLCGVLLAGCPVLEELSVHHTHFSANPHTISSPTLKRLSMTYHSPDGVEGYTSSMTLDLPKLVYLDYYGFAMSKYTEFNLESLVEAKIDLYPVRWASWNADITDLILGLRNVGILHLSPTSVDVIYHNCRYKLLAFNNLVKLSFGNSKNKRDWELLPYLLKQSPKLETLIIHDLRGYYTCYHAAMPLNEVKVLHILSYGGTPKELEQLKFFIGGFDCLEVVQVDVTSKDESIIVETERHLIMCLGVSLPSNCQIKVI